MEKNVIAAETAKKLTQEETHAAKVFALYDVYMKLPDKQREELYKTVTENKDI